MKPFNLEEALAGKPVVTRDGRPVKIAGYNPEALYSLVGWADKSHGSWRTDGSYFDNGTSDSDLFMAVEKKTVWVGIYLFDNANKEDAVIGSFVVESKTAADYYVEKMGSVVKTIQAIEIEI